MDLLKNGLIGIFVLMMPFVSVSQNTADRILAEFNEVRIFGKLTVLMVPGNEYKVHIESNDVSLDNIKTEVNEKKLKIKMRSKLFKEPDVFIKVTYQDLKGITALADAEVNFERPVIQKFFDIKATSGSYITIAVDCRELDLKAYQGGQVQVSGNTDFIGAYVNTGGILSGTDLVCKKVRIKLNTGGKGELTVQEELEANVNTGSDFSYFGNPRITDVSTFLGGTVSAWDEEE